MYVEDSGYSVHPLNKCSTILRWDLLQDPAESIDDTFSCILIAPLTLCRQGERICAAVIARLPALHQSSAHQALHSNADGRSRESHLLSQFADQPWPLCQMLHYVQLGKTPKGWVFPVFEGRRGDRTQQSRKNLEQASDFLRLNFRSNRQVMYP